MEARLFDVGNIDGSMRELCLVLTMGRVGSTSMYESIPAIQERQKFHVHSVNVHTLIKQVMKRGSIEKSARSVQDGLRAVRAVMGFPGRVKVISLVRDVVSRELSSAFLSLRSTHSPAEVEAMLDDTRLLREFYWNKFSRGRPMVWFDNEVRNVLGMDVYESPFPSVGWKTYSNDRFDLLVIRTECDPAIKSDATSRFLGTATFPISNINSQSNKGSLAAQYLRFKTNLGLTRQELEDYAACRYQKHFYAPASNFD